ncbi:MAG: hydrogenase maturation protease [Actinomycetota bacterium]|nr:hydrogenase maturation protease [Actinomycetota bacterium]
MAAPAAADPPRRVLVACVGNPLRGDDGFGLAVASQLQGRLPADADLIETGIGALGIVHQLMNGYGALIVVDAIERRASPGAVFVLVPEVPEVTEPTLEDWQAQLADLHLAEPSRILRLARAAGVLPAHVLVVGCQPGTCDDLEERLSAPVAAAVPIVTRQVRELVAELLVELR